MPNDILLKASELFRKNEKIYINKSNELPEYCEVLHKHDFIEIAYVIAGEGIHVVGNHEYKVSKGDLFIINYDTKHGFLSKNKNTNPLIVYNCVFLPDFLTNDSIKSNTFGEATKSTLLKSFFPEEYAIGPDLHLTDAGFLEIGEIFDKMLLEYKEIKKGYIDILRAYLLELIIKIFRKISLDKSTFVDIPNKELVEKTIKYINNNLDKTLTLTSLSSKAFLSKNYYGKLFYEYTGTHFRKYIIQSRIDLACHLLKSTNKKVLEISLESGFKDLKNFYSAFKLLTSTTPTKFRGK